MKITIKPKIINKNIPIALVTSSTSESVAYKSRNNKWLDQIKNEAQFFNLIKKA